MHKRKRRSVRLPHATHLLSLLLQQPVPVGKTLLWTRRGSRGGEGQGGKEGKGQKREGEGAGKE